MTEFLHLKDGKVTFLSGPIIRQKNPKVKSGVLIPKTIPANKGFSYDLFAQIISLTTRSKE